MAVDMFLKIDGIKGESQDNKHKDECDILAYSWGGSNSGSAHDAGGMGVGKSDFQDLSVTKYTDKSSPELWKAMSTGKHIKEATLTIRKAGDKPLEYLIYKVSDFIVTSISVGSSGGEPRGTENVTLNFAKMEMKYTEQAKDGGAGPDGQFNYDLKANLLL